MQSIGQKVHEEAPRQLAEHADAIESARQIMADVVRSLASLHDRVATRILKEGGTNVIMVTVAGVDYPKIVGKDGRTVRSLRAVVAAIAFRSQLRLELDIQTDGMDRNQGLI